MSFYVYCLVQWVFFVDDEKMWMFDFFGVVGFEFCDLVDVIVVCELGEGYDVWVFDDGSEM